MTNSIPPIHGFLVAALWLISGVVSSAFDPAQLDLEDRRLFGELQGPEILQKLAAKATTDNSLSKADAGAVVPLLQAAQKRGLPLAALMYSDWMGQDEMRRVLTIEFKRSFPFGGVGWKYGPALVDAFLAARDSPPSLYFDTKYSYREGHELLSLESFFRDTVLENFYTLAYPDKTSRPQHIAGGQDGLNAPTLKRVIESILNSPAADLNAERRQMLKAQLVKVNAFIATPPPLPVERWRKAAAAEEASRHDRTSTPPPSGS